MSYIRRYTGQIQGHNNKSYTVDIFSQVGNGLDQDLGCILADGATLSYEGGDISDPLYPIVASSLDLVFLAEHDNVLDNIRAFASACPEATYVRMSDNASDWTWYGHLSTDNVNYEITCGATQVSLAFIDGLAMLKDIEFVSTANDLYDKADEEDGGPYKSGRTASAMLMEIFYKLPWFREHYDGLVNPRTTVLRETPMMRHNSIGYADQDQVVSNLATTGFNPEAFIEEKESRRKPRLLTPATQSNCYDVLADIVSALGCKVCWNGLEWHVYAPLAFPMDVHQDADYHDTIIFEKQDFIDYPGGRSDGTLEQVNNVGLDAYYAVLAGSDINFTSGRNRYIATHEKGGADYVHRAVSPTFEGTGTYNTAGQLVSIEGANDPRNWNADTAFNFDSRWDHRLYPNLANTEDNLRIPADTEFSTRIKFNFSWDGGFNRQDPAATMIGLVVLKVRIGYSDLNDPYVLQGLVQKVPTADSFNYRPNPVDVLDQWPLDPDYVQDMEWVLESETSEAAQQLVYLPIHWDGSYTSGEAPYIEQDGKKYYGTVHQQSDGSEPFEWDDKNHYVTFDFDSPLPPVPVECHGVEFEVGLAAMAGRTDANYLLFNTVTDTYDAGYTSMGDAIFADGNAGGSGFGLSQWNISNVTLAIGDSTPVDRLFEVTVDGACDVMRLSSSRVATPDLAVYGTNTIAMHDAWTLEPNDQNVAGQSNWTRTGLWRAYDDGTADFSNASFLVILREFAARFENGIYNPRLSLTPRFTGAFDIPTPDKYYLFNDIMIDPVYGVYDNIVWRSNSTCDMEGIVYSQDRGPLTGVDVDEELVVRGPRGRGPLKPVQLKKLNNLLPADAEGLVNINNDGTSSTVTGNTNDVLSYVGNKWVNSTPASVAGNFRLEDVGDISLTRSAGNDGKVLAYDSANDRFELVDGGTGGGGGTASGTAVSSFIDADTALAVDTFADTNDGAEYSYKMKDSTNGYIRTGRLYVVHNGTDAYVSDQSTITMGGETELPDFTASVSGGTVTLYCTNGNNYDFTATRNFL